MKRARKEPINIDPHEVIINAYPFGDDKPVVAWVEDGYITCVSGAIAAGVKLEIGPQTILDHDGSKMRAAAKVAAAKRYRNVWAVHSDGTRTRLQTL